MLPKEEEMETTELRPLPIVHEGQTYDLFLQDEEPLARDLDVGAWLGYERPRVIRELIERHREALGEVSPYRTAKPPGEGGRPEEGYLLQEHQVLFLAAKSETPRATAVLQLMIAVFIAARRGLLGGVSRLELNAALAPVLARLDRRAEKQVQQLVLTLEVSAEAAPQLKMKDRAQAILLVELQQGPRRATEIEAAALARGISYPSLRRARKALRVRAQRRGGVGAAGSWWLALPEVN